MMRSLLFVPGDDAKKFPKAIASESDVLIFDLEDSVAPASKVQARITTATQLRATRTAQQGWWVRVNGIGSGLTLADLASVMPYAPDGVVLPKCSGPEDVHLLSNWLDAAEACLGREQAHTGIIAIATESAKSVLSLPRYASFHLSRLSGLMWGAEDLSADIGAEPRKIGRAYRSAPRLARDLCLLAASAMGVPAIDAVNTNFGELEELALEATEAAHDGFSAKAAVHPKQIETINQTFSVSTAQIEWARKVYSALDSNGVAKAEGIMIDTAHRRHAERILIRAGDSSNADR